MIEYLSHSVYQSSSLTIRFNINGFEFSRTSMIRAINYFEKGRLLWWKDSLGQYCTEHQTIELEGIFKAFVFPESFKEQLMLTQ